MPYYLEGFELSQFHAIVDSFQRCVNNSDLLPDQFKTEDIEVGYFGTSWLLSNKKKRVLYQYNTNCFYMNFWKLPPATMIPIKNAINTICAYQISRHQRVLGSGNLYDPTNLVCEQLKNWLMQLAKRNLVEVNEVRDEISGYIEYLKVLEKNNIFPNSKMRINHSLTMNGTLLEVSSSLERTIDEIENLVQRRSLREVITNITKYTEGAVDGGLQYLFYIIRGNKSPTAINVRNLAEHNDHSLQTIKDTRSYQLLKILLASPYIRQVNRSPAVISNCENIFSNHIDDFNIKKEKGNNQSPDSKTARKSSYLNHSLGGNLIPDRNFIRRWWSNVHSGIDSYFQNQPYILKEYVQLHAIIERLSYFTIICRHMEELVDYFGMIIWAELGTRILEHFQEAFRRLNLSYRDCIQNIHTCAKTRYDTLVKKNKSSHWRCNYNSADRIFDSMMRDMEHALSHVSSIPTVIDRFRKTSCDHQAQERLTSVMRNLNKFGILFHMQPIDDESSRETHALCNTHNLCQLIE